MLGKLFRAVFGSKNDRELKKMGKVVQQINALETQIEALSDDELKGKTIEYRERYEKGETLEQLLPEAFATVREASRRAMAMRHFDVQMIGGMTLHQGRISEMKTGEGKTLVATLATYLNAIPGKGVHIVTVNDYLATRDSNWMRPVYEALGMTVGSIVSMQDPQEKYNAYRADITYGTNNEFGFDYLRDNMALRKEDRVQRPLFFAVIDEVDSILIDEARTPLIISGAAEDSSLLYKKINALIPQLKLQPESDEEEPTEIGHFTIDEKVRSIELTETGHQLVEELLIGAGLLKNDESLYQASNLGLVHHINSGLRAHHLYQRDVEYIVQENQVVLIDEHTGRTMQGRRLSEGLHQAIEAKEGVNIQAESQTMASTTFQNYFRLYPKLSGMTGTADTEAFEFRQIYGLDVVVIPTNRPVSRQDLNDLIFLNVEDKYEAIIEDVKAFREKKAPVLVGTASVETSEEMSKRLNAAGIKHEVLNAKQHDREADIIAEAGRPGAVTIATNMAGRGTDIVLGGKWEVEVSKLQNPTETEVEAIKADWKVRHQIVLDAGGLHIIGTERHESRRIDNQLRGRAGRQGDPGLSRFYLSLEDNLMRIFASERMRSIMQTLGMEKGEAIEHRMVTNAIEKAQRKVEGRNFDYRKQLLEYDDVANDQRRVIYTQRNELLDADDIEEAIAGIRDDVVAGQLAEFVPPQSVEEQWDIAGLEKRFHDDYGVDLPIQQWLDEDDKLNEESLGEKLSNAMSEYYQQEKVTKIGDIIRTLEKQLMLQVLDTLWKEHLQNMDNLRQGINLRAYAQRNPKQEYKRESFALFESLLEALKFDVTRVLFRIEPVTEEQLAEMDRRRQAAAEAQKIKLQHEEFSALETEAPGAMDQVKPERPYVRTGKKIGRNDNCPCGSGKKYKACHGKLA
ncbi:preprotein translocase subunit SecA [Teredinibacter purpureus]|uniref:preprotein translocase subunit SecA n=1 Tax=Teredinibacter purpureus TaxID=2731756 RepID=UPI0005F788BF|nr:preprotein translocase subunit SecA [Teredinibacter purpureus]